MSNFPTIESFFQPLRDQENEPPRAKLKVGDGFTEDELAQALDPTSATWNPQGTYDEVGIGELSPGPRKAKITGRVVNFYEAATPSKMPTAATGYFKLIVKDETGVLLVKLWFAHREYEAVLGSLVSFWTTHVSAVSKAPGSLTVPNPSLCVNIFPERDMSCCFVVLDPTGQKNSCKIPPAYNGPPIPDLVTLKQFVEGGSDIPNAKILVCVRSMSPPKLVTTKKGTTVLNINVSIFDHSRQTGFTLWGKMIASAATWTPCSTILLMSNISCTERGWLGIKSDSQIEVDPDTGDAHWLRKKVQRETQKQRINPAFPENLFDVEAALTSPRRIFFTLADMESFVHAAPNRKSIHPLKTLHQLTPSPETYTGYFSLIITTMNITSLHHKNQLLSGECCSIPHHTNTPLPPSNPLTCPKCAQPTTPRLNPRLVGPLVDETGVLATGTLIWSDGAWTQLLGRSAEELCKAEVATLRYLEERMRWLRVTLVMGWGGDDERTGGKLCVLRVLG